MLNGKGAIVTGSTSGIEREYGVRVAYDGADMSKTSFAIAAWMGTCITHEWAPDDFIPMAPVQSVGQGLT